MTNFVHVLRTCNADMSTHGGFIWPTSGYVEAPDWNSAAKCGNGLHGLLRDEGNGKLLCWADDAKWLVVKVDASTIVELGDKVKFPAGEVVFVGDRYDATQLIAALHPEARAIVGHTTTAGDYGTAIAGEYGTAIAGYRGTATAGRHGTATAGDCGTATAGRHGTATAGDYGTATAGEYGTAIAGYRGTATAGEYGTITIKWYDGKQYHVATAYVGENGIEANVAYKLTGKFFVPA